MGIIKQFKQFNEGIDKYLKGPTFDEIIKASSVDDFLKIMLINQNQDGIGYALKQGASNKNIDEYEEMIKWFFDILENMEEKITVSNHQIPIEENIIYYMIGDNIYFDLLRNENNMSQFFIGVDYFRIMEVMIDKYGYSENDIIKFITKEFSDYTGLENIVVVIEYEYDQTEDMNTFKKI